ncbi:hypothetical protein ACFVJ8_19710 [Streptomyces yangpuensis]|uniref:hypothetical protein n=1 Tax=Streptomyces yangpuensis TaxID=1648182 RepID=UPI00362B6451
MAEDLLAKLEKAWPPAQRALVALRPQTPHLPAAGSDPYVQLHDPDLAIAAVRLVAGRPAAVPRAEPSLRVPAGSRAGSVKSRMVAT